jgi:hypothetical protein
MRGFLRMPSLRRLEMSSAAAAAVAAGIRRSGTLLTVDVGTGSSRTLRGTSASATTCYPPELAASLTFDTGEAEDLVLLPSPDRDTQKSILLVSRVRLATGRSSRYLRLLD